MRYSVVVKKEHIADRYITSFGPTNCSLRLTEGILPWLIPFFAPISFSLVPNFTNIFWLHAGTWPNFVTTIRERFMPCKHFVLLIKSRQQTVYTVA